MASKAIEAAIRAREARDTLTLFWSERGEVCCASRALSRIRHVAMAEVVADDRRRSAEWTAFLDAHRVRGLRIGGGDGRETEVSLGRNGRKRLRVIGMLVEP